MSETPENIDEFNQIAGLIFAQLYREFPVAVDIDRGAIAKALGIPEVDWGNQMLPSGRSFNDVLTGTIGWLKVNNYTINSGSVQFQRVILATKGLEVMNVVPARLKETLGTELRKAAERSSGPFDLSKIGDLIGGAIGGFTKSISS